MASVSVALSCLAMSACSNGNTDVTPTDMAAELAAGGAWHAGTHGTGTQTANPSSSAAARRRLGGGTRYRGHAPSGTATGAPTTPAGIDPGTTAPTRTDPAGTAPSTPAPTTPAGTSPTSSSSPPVAAPGWRRTFFDDFTGTNLNTAVWGTYQGRPSNNSVSTWASSNVLVQNGDLVLRSTYANGAWVTGGLAERDTQQYGKWEVRYRIEKAPGVQYVALLYPAGGGWPPEIDFAEDYGGGNRKAIMGVTHWSSSNQQNLQIKNADFSQWHTAGVILEPGKVSYLLDGKVWATTAHSPVNPMWLGIQTQVNVCGSSPCTTSVTPSTVDMEVDWVARYSKS